MAYSMDGLFNGWLIQWMAVNIAPVDLVSLLKFHKEKLIMFNMEKESFFSQEMPLHFNLNLK